MSRNIRPCNLKSTGDSLTTLVFKIYFAPSQRTVFTIELTHFYFEISLFSRDSMSRGSTKEHPTSPTKGASASVIGRYQFIKFNCSVLYDGVSKDQCCGYRETMESMLAEQQYLRSPLRPFELDQHNNNLTLEEKAILAARSQLFLRAAYPLYGVPAAALWGQWACLAPQLLAHHHLASGSGLQLPRPIYAGAGPAAAAAAAAALPPSALQHHRFSPYPARRASPGSSPDSLRAGSPHPIPHPHPMPPHSPT